MVQYYLLAGDVHRLIRLHWAAETSLLQTLAAKHRSTVAEMARKHRPPSHAARATYLLPGHHPTPGQEIPGRQVRWHSAETAEEGSHHRPPSRPAHPPQGADHPAPGTAVRVVRHDGQRGNPPGPQARRSHQDRTAAARVGTAHGPDAQENPRGLHPLPHRHPPRAACRPHGVVAGELRASKLARVVRTEVAGKGPAHSRHLAGGLPVYRVFRIAVALASSSVVHAARGPSSWRRS